MRVVSNTSPVLNLARVGRLSLLQSLYGEVSIPEAVERELRAYLTSATAEPSWLIVRPIEDLRAAALLRGDLDPGEAEAIVLALEAGAEMLLIDERLGRRTAARLGVRHTGLLGVLVEAKTAGLLEAVAPVLRELTEEAGFWVRRDLRASVLELVGE